MQWFIKMFYPYIISFICWLSLLFLVCCSVGFIVRWKVQLAAGIRVGLLQVRMVQRMVGLTIKWPRVSHLRRIIVCLISGHIPMSMRKCTLWLNLAMCLLCPVHLIIVQCKHSSSGLKSIILMWYIINALDLIFETKVQISTSLKTKC